MRILSKRFSSSCRLCVIVSEFDGAAQERVQTYIVRGQTETVPRWRTVDQSFSSVEFKRLLYRWSVVCRSRTTITGDCCSSSSRDPRSPYSESRRRTSRTSLALFSSGNTCGSALPIYGRRSGSRRAPRHARRLDLTSWDQASVVVLLSTRKTAATAYLNRAFFYF